MGEASDMGTLTKNKIFKTCIKNLQNTDSIIAILKNNLESGQIIQLSL